MQGDVGRKERSAQVICACLVAVWCSFWLCGRSLADTAKRQIAAVYAGEDENNGYRYEWPGIGGFSSSVQEGAGSEIVVITADEGVEGEMYQNGELLSWENGDILYENGAYEYRAYSEDESMEGNFSFRVENTYFTEQDAGAGIQVIKNPELKLSYNEEQKQYVYQLPNQSSFSMSVPLGGMTDRMVSISLSSQDGVYAVQKDGNRIVVPQPLVFSEPGTYSMMLMSAQQDVSLTDTNTYQVTVCFSIFQGVLRETDIVNAPIGFAVASVQRDAQEISSSKKAVYLQEDGRYQIRFSSLETPEIEYSQQFVVDRTPPFLKFSQSIYEGSIRPPLSFRPSENGCEIQVYRNGETAPVVDNLITDGGFYTITVKDAAGNERAYEVQMGYVVPVFSRTTLILSVLVLFAAAGWFLHLRRNMQIL